MNVVANILGRNGNSESAMSFVDHIEALRWHIIRSLLAVMMASILVFINIEWIFDHIILGPAHTDFVAYRAMCTVGGWLHVDGLCLQELNLEFQNTELSGQFMMSFSVSFFIGFIVAFPYIFFELWKFIKPALTERELKSAKGIVLWSSVLFFTGVLFAYYLIAPFTINFFANYQLSPSFRNIITMSNYYDTINDLILGIGIVFELPVVVYFLSRAGILTPGLMREKRKYAILIIFVLAAVITPPDWFTIWLVALPLLGLYQLSIGISRRAAARRA